MITVQKVYIDELHYHRVFDRARPPLDRLAETGVLDHIYLEMLFSIRDQVDILALCERLVTNIDHLWRVRTPKIGTPVNIFDTLRKEVDNPSVTFSFDLVGKTP